MPRRILALLLMLALVGVSAACGDDDDGGSADVGATDTEEVSCEAGKLPLKEADTLTVATGEPAFEPWVVDDDPTNGSGFESAVVYAVADELGIEKDDVTWIRTGFDEAVAPGDKDFDFNVQQYSITDERD